MSRITDTHTILCSGTGSSDAPPTPVRVIGVGNLLMGDEGVGIHALRKLEEKCLPPGVAVLDGGTGGINLLEAIGHSSVVIMIDATCDGSAAGTIRHIRPANVADLPRDLSAHDFGLKDLFAAAALLGQFPDIHLFTIAVETVTPMSMELTPEVAQSVPEVVRRVQALADELAAREHHDA